MEILATIAGALIIILIGCVGMALGQWFGRPPIRGKCSPDNPDCCMHPSARTAASTDANGEHGSFSCTMGKKVEN